MPTQQQTEQQQRPRSADEERASLIRAYAEHGLGVPPELEMPSPVKPKTQERGETGDKKGRGETTPTTHRKDKNNMEPTLIQPAVNPNPNAPKTSATGLGAHALVTAIDAGIYSVAAVATVTVSTLIVNKLRKA